MTGTGLTSVHAAHHLALAAPNKHKENRLLHVGIGATGWGHNTCIGNPGTSDLSPAALEARGVLPNADAATTQQITDARQRIDDWLDAVPGRRLADWDEGIWSPAHLVGRVTFTTDS
ncbi:hypothetical protein [Candidatus Poriferisodalis sp.]|uniref:hypothetical protein n=1 Tax=Candidatus Poriferisodalis sp. TaxID=3101277 RepID=UPI003AF9EE15